MANPKITEPTNRAPGETRRIPRLRLKSHRIGSGTLTGLGGLLMALELPFLGLPAACVGGGYLLATYLLSGVLKAGDEDIDNWAKVLEDREKTLTARTAEVKQDKAAAKALLVKIEAKMRDVEQQARRVELDLRAKYEQRLAQTAGVMDADYQQRLTEAIAAHRSEADEAIAAADAHALARIKHHKSRLLGDNQQLHEEIEDLQTKLEQRDAYLLEEFNKRIESYRTGYSEIQQAIDIQGRNVGEARAAFEAQYEALLDERDRLREEVRRLSAPKRFRRNTNNDLRGNRILDFFKERGVVLEGEDWEERFNHVDYYLFPLPGYSYEQVPPLLNDLQISLGFYSKPTAAADNGFIRLGIQATNHPEDITVPTRPLSKLEDTVREANHVSIVGGSGAGKSTFTDNMIWMGRLIWPDSTCTIFDPKFQLENWQSGLRPDYKNRKCVYGVTKLSEKLYQRLDEYERLTDEGLPPVEYPRHMFVVDEAQQLYMHAQDLHIEDSKPKYPAQVSRSFTRLLNLGRALGVRGYFIRHNDLVKPLGLNDGQFDGCVNIFLGKGFIIKALTKSLKDLFSDAKLSSIQVEYEKRLKLGQRFIALVADIPKSDLYLIEMPSPGYYHGQWQDEMGESLSLGIEGGAPPPAPQAIAPQVQVVKAVRPSAARSAVAAAPPVSTAPSTAQEDSLDSLLKQGAHCPGCGAHSTSYRKRKPNGKGNVTLNCRNQECETKTFTWKVPESNDLS